MLGAGFVVLAAGIFFLPAPGPGMVIVGFGAGIIAEESLLAARLLDRCELGVRAVLRLARRSWRRAGTAARAGLVLAALVLAAAGGYGAWWFVFGR